MSDNPEIQAWAHVAQELGCRLQLRHLYLRSRTERRRYGLPSLRTRIDGVEVRAEVAGEGDPPSTMAQIGALCPGSEGLDLRAYRNYLFPHMGRASQDLLVGDPHFDRNFVVTSGDPQYARLWLSSRARRAMLDAPDYCFEVRGQRVSATSHRADDGTQLRAALQAVAALAGRGDEVNEKILRLARRLGAEMPSLPLPFLASASPGLEFISGSRRITQSIVHARIGRRGARRLLTRLWCRRLTSRTDRFLFMADHIPRRERPALATRLARADLKDKQPDGFIVHAGNSQRLYDKLSSAHPSLLARVHPLIVSCSEGAVELVWEGAQLDEHIVREGAELCEQLAVDRHTGHTKGPYR